MRSMISEEVRWIPYSVFNSFIAAAAVMFIVLVLGSLASYAYARLRFPGRDILFGIPLAPLMIPPIVTWSGMMKCSKSINVPTMRSETKTQ